MEFLIRFSCLLVAGYVADALIEFRNNRSDKESTVDTVVTTEKE